MATAPETLLAKSTSGGANNDIAMLQGARFVSAVETDQGRRIAEALVKQATGGDRLTARFLYGEYFEFPPDVQALLGDQPQARHSRDRSRDVAAGAAHSVRGANPRVGSGPASGVEDQGGRAAGCLELADRGLPCVADGGAHPAGTSPRRNGGVPGRAGRARTVPRRGLRGESRRRDPGQGSVRRLRAVVPGRGRAPPDHAGVQRGSG
jgi:hypothetical protein